MGKVKCHQCGLVNWQGAAHCARCNGSLSAASYSTGLNPFENESKSGSGFGAAKIVVLTLVLVAGGFAAYQFTRPESPKKPTAQEQQQMRDSEDVQKRIQAAQQQGQEAMAQMQEDLKKAAEKQEFDPEQAMKQWKNPQMRK